MSILKDLGIMKNIPTAIVDTGLAQHKDITDVLPGYDFVDDDRTLLIRMVEQAPVRYSLCSNRYYYKQ